MSVIHKIGKGLFSRPLRKKEAEIDLAWVDEFIANVRPYIFVREEDQILIKRPNQAQKLNASGARLLKTLLDGASIHTVLADLDYDPQKTVDVANFLYAVRQQLEGKLDRFSCNPAVEVQPFDMKFSQYPVLSEVAGDLSLQPQVYVLLRRGWLYGESDRQQR